MSESSEPSRPMNAPHEARFHSSAVRRILQLAVEEQHRLECELVDSYSFEELEEMAAEARISPEALSAAIQAQQRESTSAGRAQGTSGAPERSSGWQAALERRLPRRWSPTTRSLVLTGGGFAALSGLLLLLAVMAPTAFWLTSLSLIALCVLILFGASPF